MPEPTSRELILPGGKVDPEAVRRAFEEVAARVRSEEAGEDEAHNVSVTFELQRDLKSRLDRYLTSRITFMSRNQLQRLIESGAVRVNGREAKASTKLREGDRVRVSLPPPPDTSVKAERIPIEVLHEDEHIIVLNKQPDIIVHPARSELAGTMINALAWHFRHASPTGGELSSVGEQFARPGVVHRLDRDTSGCIVFAKTDEAHWKIGRQFEQRTVDKRYLAVTQGRVEPNAQVIDKPLGPHPSREKGYREKVVVRHDDLGKPSVTICRVREHYRLHDRAVGDQAFSLVELELKTGRTHQIRVHLSSEGWPIVGDDLYGGRPFTLPDGRKIARQMLHAALLAFEHPATGEPMVFTAPPPEDLRALVDALRTPGVDGVHVQGTVPLARLGLEAAP
ncbi:MAG: RluA family pseudouridine synthase [Phycisphaerales bacterium JB059]